MKKKRFLFLAVCLMLTASLALPALAAETGETGSAPCQHSYGGWYPSGEGHARTCANCGAAEHGGHSWNSGSGTAATCTEAGSLTYSCTDCGASKTETPAALGHSYGNWAMADAASHSRTCSRCANTESQAHSMANGLLNPAPTCKDPGLKTYHCENCSYSYSEEVPVSSEHSYGEYAVDDSGHSRTCGICGKVDSGSHSLTKVEVPSTCTDNGGIVEVCTVCEGYRVLEVWDLAKHTYKDTCDPDCNVCGAVREVEHTVAKVWSRNGRTHWHACTVCGEKFDEKDHYPGPAATETEDQICLICSYVMTPRKGHEHDYASRFTSDAAGHWYPCSGCDDQKDLEEHLYDSECDDLCDTCGYRRASAHSFDGTWISDEQEHWSECGICGELSQREAHVPGDPATDTAAQLCTVCGYELAPPSEHVHESSTGWMKDSQVHWRQCACGEAYDEAPHAWDQGRDNGDDTVTYSCTLCAADRTEGEARNSGGAVWLLVVAGIALVCAGVAGVFLLMMAKKPKGKFSK